MLNVQPLGLLFFKLLSYIPVMPTPQFVHVSLCSWTHDLFPVLGGTVNTDAINIHVQACLKMYVLISSV